MDDRFCNRCFSNLVIKEGYNDKYIYIKLYCQKCNDFAKAATEEEIKIHLLDKMVSKDI